MCRQSEETANHIYLNLGEKRTLFVAKEIKSSTFPDDQTNARAFQRFLKSLGKPN